MERKYRGHKKEQARLKGEVHAAICKRIDANRSNVTSEIVAAEEEVRETKEALTSFEAWLAGETVETTDQEEQEMTETTTKQPTQHERIAGAMVSARRALKDAGIDPLKATADQALNALPDYEAEISKNERREFGIGWRKMQKAYADQAAEREAADRLTDAGEISELDADAVRDGEITIEDALNARAEQERQDGMTIEELNAEAAEDEDEARFGTSSPAPAAKKDHGELPAQVRVSKEGYVRLKSDGAFKARWIADGNGAAPILHRSGASVIEARDAEELRTLIQEGEKSRDLAAAQDDKANRSYAKTMDKRVLPKLKGSVHVFEN